MGISAGISNNNHVLANLTSVIRDDGGGGKWPLEMSEPTRAVTPPNTFPSNLNHELTTTPERVRQVELNRLRGIYLSFSSFPSFVSREPTCHCHCPFALLFFIFDMRQHKQKRAFLSLFSSQGKATREGSFSARVGRHFFSAQR